MEQKTTPTSLNIKLDKQLIEALRKSHIKLESLYEANLTIEEVLKMVVLYTTDEFNQVVDEEITKKKMMGNANDYFKSVGLETKHRIGANNS